MHPVTPVQSAPTRARITRDHALLAIGGLLILLVLAGLACHEPGTIDLNDHGRKPWFVGFEMAAALVYFAAVAIVRRGPLPRRTLWAVLAAATVMRLITLTAPPFLSTDLFRYVWDGRVQAQGINPYLYLPAAPQLAFLRDADIYEHTNRSEEAPTIYPPAAQLIFAAVGQVWSSVYGIKLTMALFEALAIGIAVALLRRARLPPEQVLIYAWNPLPVWEFAGNGHIDAASIGFVALAWLAASYGRRGWTGAALGLAILCKFLPAAVFPAFWRRWDWRMLLAAAAVIAALYGVYAGAGWKVLGYLPGYANEEGLESGGGFFLLRLLALLLPVTATMVKAYAAVALAGLASLAGWFALRRPLPTDPGERVIAIGRGAAILATATMIVISPHYPWYLGWLALFACTAPFRSVIYLSATAGLLYLDPDHIDLIYPLFVYLPCILLAAWDVLQPVHLRPDLPERLSVNHGPNPDGEC